MRCRADPGRGEDAAHTRALPRGAWHAWHGPCPWARAIVGQHSGCRLVALKSGRHWHVPSALSRPAQPPLGSRLPRRLGFGMDMCFEFDRLPSTVSPVLRCRYACTQLSSPAWSAHVLSSRRSVDGRTSQRSRQKLVDGSTLSGKAGGPDTAASMIAPTFQRGRAACMRPEWTAGAWMQWRADGIGMRAALPNFLQPAGRRMRSIAAAGCEPAVARDSTRR